MFNQFQETLTFDDVLLVPQASDILPKDTNLQTYLTREIKLSLPFLSAPMDTVTEHKMAIALALAGGIGIIHKNLSVEEQVEEVKKVKRFKNGFIENPLTVQPDDSIEKLEKLKEELGFKKFPVVDKKGKLLGFISDVDYMIVYDKEAQVKDRMRPVKDMVVARAGINLEKANQILRDKRIRSLCIVDSAGKLVSMVTRKDIEKNELYPQASKNYNKQLQVGAAIGAGKLSLERAEALIKAGVEVIVVDTAHGHSKGVIETVKELKKKHKDLQVVAGNIATSDAAEELIKAGADAVKVGIGPGSICTTRIISAVGVPQLSAILEVVKGVKKMKKSVPIIADGGIKTSGDIVKALAAGASTVMMGNLFAGTDEAPGRVEYVDGRMYKSYRGMGSVEAMERGSKDRYGQADISEKKKLVPEGVSGRVPYKGTVDRIIYQMSGGLRSGMGYCGAKTITELQQKAVFVKISNAGLKESHPHDLRGFDAAPNYRKE